MFAPPVDHQPGGHFIADCEGGIIFVDHRWCEITGVSANEALGDAWQKTVHPEDRGKIGAQWTSAVRSGQPFFGEARFLRPDGNVVWFEASGSPIKGAKTGDAAYLGTCTDITARRNSEARIRLYDALLSNNPDFAYVFDLNYRFAYANQSLLTMWGRTWDESIGKCFLEIGYPDWHAAMHEKEIATVIATRAPITGEIHYEGTHGRRLYEYIFTPIFSADGGVEAVAGATRDVTERKQAEERAQFLNRLADCLMPLSTEADIIREAVGLLGPYLGVKRCYFIESLKEGNLLRVAPDWSGEGVGSIAGDYPIDSFGGEDWWREFSARPLAVRDVENHPLTARSVDSYLQLGVRSYATRPFRQSGPWSVVLAVTATSPRQWTDDEMNLLDNVAARVWPLVEQARSIEILRESDRRKDHFLATLAHELRNPLAPVLAGLEIMRRADGDPTIVERIVDVIERQTRQMTFLIDDLLDISRVNTGKISLKKETVSLASVLRNAMEASEPLFAERSHVFVAHLPPDSILAEVDPSRIAQAVSNLLSNAAKYTAPGGRIALEAGTAGDDAWIRVSDNGQGINLSEQDAIFELFHQAADGRSDGLGIGLTLVRSLTQMHGGSVSVHSEGRGCGSTFSLCIPASVVSDRTLPAEEINQPKIPSGKRVLIVDDGKQNADVLAMFLELEGMEVAVAYDGLEGLEKSRSFRPDFVIMDIGMPVMDGLEAASCMRSENLPATLIALSGWGRDEDRKRSSEAGFDHHLTKPVTPAAIRELIASRC